MGWGVEGCTQIREAAQWAMMMMMVVRVVVRV